MKSGILFLKVEIIISYEFLVIGCDLQNIFDQKYDLKQMFSCSFKKPIILLQAAHKLNVDINLECIIIMTY